MKLSTKSRYGLRVLLQVAAGFCERRVCSGRALAEKQGISELYLEQLMIPLRRSGIIDAVRGCRGGYRLARSPEDISVLDIIEVFEGRLSLVPRCDGDECLRKESCVCRSVWSELSGTLRDKAGSISLDDIASGNVASMEVTT